MKKVLYILSIIVIVGLIVTNIILYKRNKEIFPRITQPVVQSTQQSSQQQTLSSFAQERNEKIDQWSGLTGTQLLALAAKENIWLEPESGIGQGKLIDLNGDGTEEAVYTGNGGNNDMSFILMKDKNGVISFAKQKNKDGSIGTLALLHIGRVMVQEKYELLPKEYGFYRASLIYDESKSIVAHKDIYNCNSLNGYVWNPTTKLFQWNAALTAKYTKQICP